MSIMSLEEITERLHQPGVRLEVVAADSGLSYGTVRRYYRGEVEYPPLHVVQALSRALADVPDDEG